MQVKLLCCSLSLHKNINDFGRLFPFHKPLPRGCCSVSPVSQKAMVARAMHIASLDKP